MLKWAMRIVAVGGALLAMAVGTAAWMHRTQAWLVETPMMCTWVGISPREAIIVGCKRRDWEPVQCGYPLDRYGVSPLDVDAETLSIESDADHNLFWHGVGFCLGQRDIASATEILCPTWLLIAVLLLPMGLWAGIGWRQRRRVMAGHCVNCGYDLRATPEKCPERGRAVKISAER